MIDNVSDLKSALRSTIEDELVLKHGVYDLGAEFLKFRDLSDVSLEAEPGGVVIIRSGGLDFKRCTDVLVSNIHVYNRDPGQPRSEYSRCVSVEGDTCTGITVSRCALFWGVDQCVSVWQDEPSVESCSVDFDRCLIGGGRRDSSHSESDRPQGHSMGALVGNHALGVEFNRCVFGWNDDRNPRIQGDVRAWITNCVVHEASQKGITLVTLPAGSPYVHIESSQSAASKVTRLTKTNKPAPSESVTEGLSRDEILADTGPKRLHNFATYFLTGVRQEHEHWVSREAYNNAIEAGPPPEPPGVILDLAQLLGIHKDLGEALGL